MVRFALPRSGAAVRPSRLGTRRGRARVGALVGLLALVGASVAACASDPEDIVTESFSVGPFDLQGVSAGEASAVNPTVTLPKPAGDIAVKAIHWRVEDGEGHEIPATDHRIHFHHIVAYSNRATDPECPGWFGTLGQRFAAPGSERTPLELPNGYAYFTGANDVWRGNIDLMNLTDTPQTGLRIAYDISYTRSRDTLVDVTPRWLDAQGCPGSTVRVPAGAAPDFIASRSRTFTMERGGTIVAVRGHLHDNGIDVALTRTNGGEDICRTTAEYDEGTPAEPGDDHGSEPVGGMPGMEHGGGMPGMDHGDPGHGDGHNESGPRIKAIPLCKNLSARIEPGEKVTVTGRYRTQVQIDDAMIKTLVYIAEDPLPDPTTTTAPPATEPPLPVDPATGAPDLHQAD
jgi:hypothetical protein